MSYLLKTIVCFAAGAWGLASYAVPPRESSTEASSAESGYLLASRAFHGAARKVLPSIVTIETFGGVASGARRGRIEGLSEPGAGPTTGMIISEDGHIITSTFNFANQPPIVTVILRDGERHVAQLRGRDESRRICVLKIEDVKDLPVPEMVPPDSLHVGQWAISVGVGYGDFEPAISAGIISALNRVHGRAIQTDANISPANYGGPLLDIEGRVIGICVPLNPQSNQQTAGVEWYDSGIGFAVPIADLDDVVAAMKEGQTLRPAILKLKLKLEGEQVVIESLPENSAAARAGLEKGDRIVSIDKQPIQHPSDVNRIVARQLAGEQTTVRVIREDKDLEFSFALEAAPSASRSPFQLFDEGQGGIRE